MKLNYPKSFYGSFGDDFYPWLWGKVLPQGLFDEDGKLIEDAQERRWIPIKYYGFIFDFKWQDWQSSVSVCELFQRADPVWKGDGNSGKKGFSKVKIKRILLKIGVWIETWQEAYPIKSNEIDKICEQISQAINTIEPTLSKKCIVDGSIERLQEKLEKEKKREWKICL